MPISFRIAENSDISQICALEDSCFPQDGWSENAITAEFQNTFSYFFVAESEKDMIGYGCIRCMDDTAELMKIAVLPVLRKQGIGGEILRRLFCLAQKKEAAQMLLEVRKSNIPAQKLYMKSGFEEIGCRKQYYRDKEDALLFRKIL